MRPLAYALGTLAVATLACLTTRPAPIVDRPRVDPAPVVTVTVTVTPTVTVVAPTPTVWVTR